MVGKVLVASVVATLALSSAGSDAWGIGAQWAATPTRSFAGQMRRQHFGRLHGLRRHYAAATQTGVYDSCWRHRAIAARWGRNVVPVWICGDYATYGFAFDWGYGNSIADRSYLYGYPLWWSMR
jgi:hypothetical protein